MVAPSFWALASVSIHARAVAVGHVVERAVDGGVAGEEDPLFGKPREAVAARVSDAEVAQLDAVLAVIEDHQVPIEQ